MSEHFSKISDIIDAERDKFIHISNALWDFAEIRFEEFQSAQLLCTALEEEGFHVDRGVSGIETAFVASFGTGGPIVGILGEYDALSGSSQMASKPEKSPIVDGGNGHGCGHNLFAAGSLAAAVAIRRYMEQNNLPGTVRFYGCPAEEGGSGKVYMARDGLFNDLDFALAWHPSTLNYVVSMSTLANCQALFKFKGTSSHSSVSPHLGRSALDAVELMNVGVNYLREHIKPDTRVSYAVTDTGGVSPNVVQAQAAVLYLMRAPRVHDVNELYERVCDVARGAALMTDTEVEIVFDRACSNLIPNNTLERALHDTFITVGVPSYSPMELELARQFADTLADGAKAYELRFLRGLGEEGVQLYNHLMEVDVADAITPYQPSTYVAPASTDVADVSWIVPTAQVYTACWALGTSGHTWQAVAQGTTSIAHKGMLQAAKVLGGGAIVIMQRDDIMKQAKEELKQRLAGDTYVCPIPAGVKPPQRR